jgi:chemosensory pili system protein ChpC
MADDPQFLKCLILTLLNENVILPDALVAEVVSVKEIKESENENEAEWYLGNMNWRGTEVPLLSYEAAGGEKISKVNLNTQAVVLYAVGKGDVVRPSPYLALVMSGVPHVSRFTREQISIDEGAENEHPMIAQKVRINGARINILDVDAMVEMVDTLVA